ncbi:MAG: ribulose-phosphate 3-epimerase [Limisphaerales bacterium]|jgi:ribulose-phosphate 3-epimerase
MAHLVAPSVLAADFGHLARDVSMVDQSEADWFHIDVMDGVFAPNISFGFPIVEVVAKYSAKYKDVHMMTSNAEPYLSRFRDAGADSITVHFEAINHLHSCVHEIKSLGMGAGVALNPATPVSMLEEILPSIDLVLIMSVNPGFGGQSFIPGSLEKIAKAKALVNRLNPNAKIQVDGGVKLSNAEDVIRAGADVVVSGSGIFAAQNPTQRIAEFKAIRTNIMSV